MIKEGPAYSYDCSIGEESTLKVKLSSRAEWSTLNERRFLTRHHFLLIEIVKMAM